LIQIATNLDPDFRRPVSMGVNNVLFISHTDDFVNQRKLLHAALNPDACVDYAHIQEREACALLDSLLESPDQFYKHARRSVSSLCTSVLPPCYNADGQDGRLTDRNSRLWYIMKCFCYKSFA